MPALLDQIMGGPGSSGSIKLPSEQPPAAISWISEPIFHAGTDGIVQEAVAVLCRNGLGRAYRSAIFGFTRSRKVVPLSPTTTGLGRTTNLEPAGISYGHGISHGQLRIRDKSGLHAVKWTILDVYDPDPVARLTPFNDARFAVLNYWLNETGYLPSTVAQNVSAVEIARLSAPEEERTRKAASVR
ncbi:hypothetical protein FS320_25125 [Microvirga tunisiensis]|uniref:Uncharacterized protein n=1 Tax=Microvirga tunisiensis TaxID=2108360 RepID=A0A5N7MMR1_9HYPH|nr:hypothetical protein [Microvirga tunisiensis]MPR10135.1 hypothetical protein [Microvirga tunisiensis]MPR28342.1 hypothetical protein [Microvirga tunisiensis]